jgi:hypothetical protein
MEGDRDDEIVLHLVAHIGRKLNAVHICTDKTTERKLFIKECYTKHH